MAESTETGLTAWDQIRAQLQALKLQQEARLNDPTVLAEKLARRARNFRERIQQAQNSGPTLPVVLFTAQRANYALPLESVLEIQQLESFSVIPGGPEFLYGVVHCRGTILSLLNLAGLMGSSQSGIADVHSYLVAQGAGRRVAIAAGVVEDLSMVPLNEIKSAPEWGGKIPHHWIRGVYREDCLILELDAILADQRVARWNHENAGLAIHPS